MAISHFLASLNPVSQLVVLTVNVSVIAILGNNPESILPLLSNTGIVQLVVPVSLLAAVHNVGVL